MKGLLIKEFYSLKTNFIIYLVVTLVLVVVFAISSSSVEPTLPGEEVPAWAETFGSSLSMIAPLTFLCGYYPAMLVIISYQLDEKARWNPFILTCGVKKSTILLSKIVMETISTLIYMVLFILGMIFMASYVKETYLLIAASITVLTCSLLGGTFNMLICNVFGSAKAAVISSFGSMLLLFIPLGCLFLGMIESVYPYLVYISLGCFLVFGVGFGALFYFLALMNFKKKDF